MPPSPSGLPADPDDRFLFSEIRSTESAPQMMTRNWLNPSAVISSLVSMRFLVWIPLLLLGTFLPLRAAADENQEGTYLDPATAPIDYQIQGEYLGKAGEESIRYGAQIIALGKGKFRLVGYAGGLPGDGWDPATGKIEIDGELQGEQAVFTSDLYEVRVSREGVLIPMSKADGVARGELNRTVRRSPTLEAEPPSNATILFDGGTAEAFSGGVLTPEKYLAADCESLAKFGDHTLHLEFMTPFKPEARGQGRGNSGVYVQSRYEVQVLDSFGLSGENNECGGIYQIAAPKTNMCFPPLQWQTYDIEFVSAKYDAAGNKTSNARITILHNGVKIHDNLELPRHTPGRAAEGPELGGLYLQGHGNPVVYRNIWVVPSAS